MHRREHHRRRREALARLRAVALTLKDRRRRQRFTIDGEARARPARARRQQRLQPRPALARRARAPRRGQAASLHPARLPPDHVGGAQLHRARDRLAATAGSAPPSTASRSSSTRRSRSGSSRARYACSCRARQSDRISTNVSNASSSAAGSSSGANQRSSTRSSAGCLDAAHGGRRATSGRARSGPAVGLHPDAEELDAARSRGRSPRAARGAAPSSGCSCSSTNPPGRSQRPSRGLEARGGRAGHGRPARGAPASPAPGSPIRRGRTSDTRSSAHDARPRRRTAGRSASRRASPSRLRYCRSLATCPPPSTS